MSKRPYIKKRTLSQQQIARLKNENGALYQAGLYNPSETSPDGSSQLKLDPSVRSTTVKNINYGQFRDICFELEQLVSEWDCELNPKDFQVREFNYLIYKQGDHFCKHRDFLGERNVKSKEGRIFSTTTILSKTDDLEGGDFLLWDETDLNSFQITLDVGETILFDSWLNHQITPVIKGQREALVAWIYYKKP